mgnify:CR=1 FL=1
MSFQSLGLSDALLKAVSKQGYSTPTPIQNKAIPLILERKDIMASAQTGTGKTAAFVLPILNKLIGKKALKVKENMQREVELVSKVFQRKLLKDTKAKNPKQNIVLNTESVIRSLKPKK